MAKKANYKNLTNYLLNDVPKEQNKVDLTFDLLREKLGNLPKSSVDGKGFTVRSPIGRAINSAGFIFETSYKEEKIVAERNEKEAKAILTANDRKKRVINKRVFLNVIFPRTAKYVNTKGNIGHEIIDIFGADGGKYYYYLNPWGLVSKTNVPDVIISMCQSSTGLYKILNKAVIKKPDKVAVATKTEAKKTKLYLKQKEKYKYNNKFLEEYFEENAGDNAVFVSFECEGIYEPTKPIYIAFKAFKQRGNRKGVYKLVSTDQGQTTKFVDFGPSDQKMLEELVDADGMWSKTPIKSFEEYARGFEQGSTFEYFKELGIESQELQYSNALKFFLENQDLTNAFLKKIGCEVKKGEKYNIDREEYNIDLLFTNFNKIKKPENKEAEKIIVIENKIKANVTPSDNEKTLAEQIEKVFMHVYKIKKKTDITAIQKNEIKQIADFLNIDNSKVPSQLSKYYIYAVIVAKKRGWSKRKIEDSIKCFFLCPNYSTSFYETTGREKYLQNNTFVGGDKVLFLQEKYKLITYKDIMPVFEKHLEKMAEGKEKYFLSDFVISLKRQANDRDDSLEKSMIEMFYLRSIK